MNTEDTRTTGIPDTDPLTSKPKVAPHPFRPMHQSDVCGECDEYVYDAIHQPPLPKWIKCAKGHALELTDAYRFVTCPWCQSSLTIQW